MSKCEEIEGMDKAWARPPLGQGRRDQILAPMSSSPAYAASKAWTTRQGTSMLGTSMTIQGMDQARARARTPLCCLQGMGKAWTRHAHLIDVTAINDN
jgi:hypothetical protein